jgi:prevent-host-death family protein
VIAEPDEVAQLELPVLDEAPAALWEAAQGGQPVVLTRAGLPALVVVDVDTWREVEQLAEAAS